MLLLKGLALDFFFVYNHILSYMVAPPLVSAEDAFMLMQKSAPDRSMDITP